MAAQDKVEEWKQRLLANPFKYALILLLVLLVLFFFLLPAYRGYRNNKLIEESGIPQAHIKNLSGLYASAQQCEQDLTTSKNQLLASRAQVAECMNQSSEMQTGFNTQITTLSSQVGTLTTEVSALQANISALSVKAAQDEIVIADAARRICCIRRVDDPTINSYTVANGRITCVAGGGMNLSC